MELILLDGEMDEGDNEERLLNLIIAILDYFRLPNSRIIWFEGSIIHGSSQNSIIDFNCEIEKLL